MRKQGNCNQCGGHIPQQPDIWQGWCDDCQFKATLQGKGVPREIVKAIHYEQMLDELDYADNERAYRVKDNFLKDDFIKSYRRGFCGSMEGSATDDNGDKWIIGCNYGH